MNSLPRWGLLLGAVLFSSAPAFAFADADACASCHPAQAKPQPATSMAHALELVPECGILRSHPLLTFRKGPYSYKIERHGEASDYTVSDGAQTMTVPVKYALGLGSAGQTYIFEKDGRYYESYVSFYREIDGLDVTLGDINLRPTSLLEAAGRSLGDRELTLCFGCHSTNSISSGKFVPETLLAGVRCERCHGDTQRHLEAMRTGNAAAFAVKELRGMTAEESTHFCGQCHRTWEQIASNGPHGQQNVRFQPYRLTNSKCFDADDQRISCLACHNPHQEIDRVSAHYDSKCQTCHGGERAKGKICKVGVHDCASCHMPKVALLGGHHEFTDHEIRIVKPGEGYPD